MGWSWLSSHGTYARMNYFYAENGFDMVNRRRRGNTMTERRMTSNYVKTQHRKLKIK
jgi:hypothetical protein